MSDSESELLHQLFEAAPDATCVVDAAGKLVRVNAQAEQLFGYAREELLGQPVEILLPSRSASQHVTQRQAYMKNPVTRPMGVGRTLLGRRKDGSEIPLEIMLSPVRLEKQTLYVAVARDASELRKSARQIQTSELLFRSLFEKAPDAIVTVDEKGTILNANRQVETLLGYSPDEIKDQPIEMLVPAAGRGKHESYRHGYITKPASRPMGRGMELHAQHKDGRQIPVDIMLSPVELPTGRIVISIIRDITERRRFLDELKERAAQLSRSNQELEQFAYIASHDLQEPLRSIAASCQMIERRLKGQADPEVQEFLGFAVDGAKRMQELISDMLALSRVGSKDLERTPVDLTLLMQRLTAVLGPVIEERQAKVSYAGLPVVLGDASQLSQLLQNLITNALKFQREGIAPEVHVSAEPVPSPTGATSADKEPARWRIAVRDNGIGIDPRYSERVFVIFKRLHTRDKYPGTGIGLSIAKKIVERHGGKIWLESEVGKGTTFFFELAAAS